MGEYCIPEKIYSEPFDTYFPRRSLGSRTLRVGHRSVLGRTVRFVRLLGFHSSFVGLDDGNDDENIRRPHQRRPQRRFLR